MAGIVYIALMQYTSGIYKITDERGRIYIGSSKHCEKRMDQHKKQFKGGNHPNRKLRCFSEKHYDGFVFQIIEECEMENLITREQFYIDKLKPYYNVCTIAQNPPNWKGKTHSSLTIEKMKIAQNGRALSDEHKAKLKEQRSTPEGRQMQKIKSSQQWKNFSPEAKAERIKKMNDARISNIKIKEKPVKIKKVRVLSEENKKKLYMAGQAAIAELRKTPEWAERARLWSLNAIKSNIGRKHKPETIDKLKIARQKRVISEETKMKLRGKKRSEEDKLKMRKPRSEQAKMNMRIGWEKKKAAGYVCVGRPHTEETKIIISQKAKARHAGT